MRRCDERAEALSAFLDGELPPEERRELERHLSGCDGCRERLEELRELGEGLRAWPDADPPEWIGRAALERARRSRAAPLRLLAAAASLVLVALAVLWAVRERPASPPPEVPPAAEVPSAPGAPGDGALVLPEGARVEELRVSVHRGGVR
jgi:anti-sigma factor RsiW